MQVLLRAGAGDTLQILRTRARKTFAMLTQAGTEVSKKGTSYSMARSSPSLVATCRSPSRSHLLPQSTMGTLSTSLTPRIRWRHCSISSRDWHEVRTRG